MLVARSCLNSSRLTVGGEATSMPQNGVEDGRWPASHCKPLPPVGSVPEFSPDCGFCDLKVFRQRLERALSE